MSKHPLVKIELTENHDFAVTLRVDTDQDPMDNLVLFSEAAHHLICTMGEAFGMEAPEVLCRMTKCMKRFYPSEGSQHAIN